MKRVQLIKKKNILIINNNTEYISLLLYNNKLILKSFKTITYIQVFPYIAVSFLSYLYYHRSRDFWSVFLQR